MAKRVCRGSRGEAGRGRRLERGLVDKSGKRGDPPRLRAKKRVNGEVRKRRAKKTVDYDEVENHQQFNDHSYIEVGGMSLRTLKFSLLNFAGNKLPMGSTNMSFQLVFGFPET